MFKKSDKRYLYWLIDQYLSGAFNASSFCAAYYDSLDLEVNPETLTKLEDVTFSELYTVASRFSDSAEDHKNYPGTYFTEDELRQKIIDTKNELSKANAWSILQSKATFYDRSNFLEYFDKEKIIDTEAGIYSYEAGSNEGLVLSVFIIINEGTICLTLRSKEGAILLDFALNNIQSIICNKDMSNVIRCLFYNENKENPIVTAMIKPNISLTLDL